QLNLSEGEYVILRIKRHPIGLFAPIAMTSFAVIFFVSFAFLVSDYYDRTGGVSYGGYELPAQGIIVACLLLLALLSSIVGAVAVWVYQKNKFYLTNESVIQEIQHGL